MLKWLWDKVDDKHTAFIVCITLSLLVMLAATVDVRGDETTWEIVHNHSKRLTIFNTDSIDNHTKMIIASADVDSVSLKLYEIKDKIWKHEAKLYDLVDTDGFKSQFHKVMWERRDNEIKKELDKLEKKLEGHTSEFESRVMFASRDR